MVKRKYYLLVFTVIAIFLGGYVLYENYKYKKEHVTYPVISTKPDVEEVNTYDGSFDKIISQRNEDVMRILEEQLDSNSLYSSEILYGNWFKPHEACYENCAFFKDHTFNMVSYGLQEQFQLDSPNIIGTFTQKGDSIYLQNEDGWNFSLRHENMGGDWYVTKDGEYEIFLVKGSLE